MISELKHKVNKSTIIGAPWTPVVPHRHILEIPFIHRKRLSNRFNDVLGLHSIDHLSIDIITPNREWISLSSTPSMLHNLITSGLWVFDGNIAPIFFEKLSFYSWEQAYFIEKKLQLIALKERSYNFHYGFCLSRQVNNFAFIYSFSTKKILSDYYDFFRPNFDDLLKIGDYCQKYFRDIYQENCEQYAIPILYEFVPFYFGKPEQLKIYPQQNVLLLNTKNHLVKNNEY